MKCPKCGSKIKGYHTTYYDRDEEHYLTKYNKSCNCTCWEFDEFKQLEHQQRLDNVLKHFEKSNEFYWKPILTNTKDGILVSIYHENETFYLECRNTYAGNKIQNQKEISFNTVEALLKDLGVME